LYNLLQNITPVTSVPDVRSWVSDTALALFGISSIGFDLSLQRQNKLEPLVAAGPRRGFVFALLGGGIISLAIGSATALYAWGHSAFWHTDQ
jgi:hypothetical protein